MVMFSGLMGTILPPSAFLPLADGPPAAVLLLSWRLRWGGAGSSASASSSSSPASSMREASVPPLKSWGVRVSRSPSNWSGGGELGARTDGRETIERESARTRTRM